MLNASFNLPQLKTITSSLWQSYKTKKIWAFHGLVGAGKTTLISSLCEYLQVEETVSSPTFSIINEYNSNETGIIYHMDWYRLKNEQEVIDAGCEECIESGNYCFIEWVENAPALVPAYALHIHLETINFFERRIQVFLNKP